MPVLLKREQNNPHDPNAVGVWIVARALIFFTDEAQIGYLPAGHVADEIAGHIDRGGGVHAEIADITGGERGKPTLGVNLLIRKT